MQATSRAGHNPPKSRTVHQHIYPTRIPYVEPSVGNYEPGTYLDRDPLAEGEEATEARSLSPILQCRGIYRVSGLQPATILQPRINDVITK